MPVDAKFGGQHGFNVAFAFTDYYGENQEKIEDESKAVLKAYLYEWGTGVKEIRSDLGEKGTVGKWVTTPLELHQCSDMELGLAATTNQAKFFPIEN